MAPEQAIGGEIDRRIDVYALGCVAYEMWTGTPPFSGPNYVTVLAKHMDEKAPRISDVRDAPPALDQLVARALSKNPEDRPADMGAVLAALQRVAEDEGVSASVVPARALDLPSMPSLGPMSRMSSTKRRFTRMKRRTRNNLVAGAAALALLGVGALVERRFGPPPPPKGPATLVLATTPPGATLKIDGHELEERSPSVARLDAGQARHRSGDAALPAGQDRRPRRQAGVDRRAAHAAVARRLQARGQQRARRARRSTSTASRIGTTPLEAEVDPWDTHTLRLERLGRRPWEKILSGRRAAAEDRTPR